MINTTMMLTISFFQSWLIIPTKPVHPYATNGPTYGTRFPIPVSTPMMTANFTFRSRRAMLTTTIINSASSSCPRMYPEKTLSASRTAVRITFVAFSGKTDRKNRFQYRFNPSASSEKYTAKITAKAPFAR